MALTNYIIVLMRALLPLPSSVFLLYFIDREKILLQEGMRTQHHTSINL